jgi:hypothetical protein
MGDSAPGENSRSQAHGCQGRFWVPRGRLVRHGVAVQGPRAEEMRSAAQACRAAATGGGGYQAMRWSNWYSGAGGASSSRSDSACIAGPRSRRSRAHAPTQGALADQYVHDSARATAGRFVLACTSERVRIHRGRPLVARVRPNSSLPHSAAIDPQADLHQQ